MRGVLVAAMLGGLLPGPLAGHEMRPAIADLTIDRGGDAVLVLELNLEATLAGLGPDHDAAEAGPLSEEYAALRALSAEALADRARQAAPRIVLLSANDAPVSLGAPDIVSPAPPEADIPRQSELRYAFALPDGTRTLTWRFAPRYGPSVLRVTPPGADAPVFADLVGPGGTATVDLGAPIRSGGGAVFRAATVAAVLALLSAAGLLFLRRRRAG